MNSQLLLWSWRVADCSLVDNLIAEKLILPTFRSKCWQDKFLCYQVVYKRTISNFPWNVATLVVKHAVGWSGGGGILLPSTILGKFINITVGYGDDVRELK